MKGSTRRHKPRIRAGRLQQLAIQPTAKSVLFWIFWLGLHWTLKRISLSRQSIAAEQQR